MDEMNIANELAEVASLLVATDFPTQESLDKYIKDHPDADKSNHKVVKKDNSSEQVPFNHPAGGKDFGNDREVYNDMARGHSEKSVKKTGPKELSPEALDRKLKRMEREKAKKSSDVVANELAEVASLLTATDFPNQKTLDRYLRNHPDADRSNHRVVKKEKRTLEKTEESVPENKGGKFGPNHAEFETLEKMSKKTKEDHVDKMIDSKGIDKVKTHFETLRDRLDEAGASMEEASVVQEALNRISNRENEQKSKKSFDVVAANNDLGDIKGLLEDMHKKQAEFEKKKEEYLRETNKMWDDATKDVTEATKNLLADCHRELVTYFKGNGMGVRKSANSGGLVEVFVGSDDGVERMQSKVSVMIHMQFEGKESAIGTLRNENLEEGAEINLKDKGTVAALVKEVQKADKKGYWKTASIE